MILFLFVSIFVYESISDELTTLIELYSFFKDSNNLSK